MTVTTKSNFDKARQITGDKCWMASSVSKSFTPILFHGGYLNERVFRENPKAVSELKEAISKAIRCIDSELVKAVIEGMKIRAQDYNQSGGDHLSNIVFKKDQGKILISQDLTQPCFLKSVYKIFIYWILFWVTFLLNTLYNVSYVCNLFYWINLILTILEFNDIIKF